MNMNCLKDNNFSVEYNTRLSGFFNGDKKYFISVDGKIKNKHQKCPHCEHAHFVDNGYHIIEDAFIVALGLKIGVSQFKCCFCGGVWSSQREFIDEVIKQYDEFVKSILLGCVRSGLSFESSCQVIKEHVGSSYSYQYLNELYIRFLDTVKKEKFSSTSGVYNFDVQFLMSNGEEIARLTIKDTVTNKVICDDKTENSKKETIQRVMKRVLKDLPVDVFIVDMDHTYPELIKELFPKAKIQWCIFHLYKLIWKEFHEECGKTIPLLQLYNTYSLFDIFFNHEKELEKLEELLKKFDRFKTDNAKSNKEIEHCLIEEFYLFTKELKREKRNNKQKTERRTLEQTERSFTKIKKEILLFPKTLQKRIKYIDDNWEKFTLFQKDSRVQPTNNGIEQYFSATLSKTWKKNFRSKAAVTRKLNSFQAEWNGNEIYPKHNLATLLTNIGRLFVLFPPT